MINFSNIHGVVDQALKPSPLGKAIQAEITHRKLQKVRNERRAERLRAAADREQAKAKKVERIKAKTAAQAQNEKARSAAQAQKVNDRQNDLWDRYQRTGKGTFHQDMLFKHGPSGPPESPREPAPAAEQPIPHIPGQVDLFSHRDVGPLAPVRRPTDTAVWPPAGHQFGLFPEPQRPPAPSPQPSQWTQGNLFESQPAAPAKPQPVQGELFNDQLKPYRQARIAPHRQVDPNTPLARPASLAPQPPTMGNLVEQARKLSAQTWIPEGYTPPQQRQPTITRKQNGT